MRKPFLVVVAMQSELNHLFPDELPEVREQSGPFEETRSMVGETPVIAIRCGIGMVAAAAATQHGIARYQPSAVFNFGCAGSHLPDLYPGDVIVGAASVVHTPVRIDEDGTEIFSHGGFGVGDDVESEHYFASDPGLLSIAESLAERYKPEKWPVGDYPRTPTVRLGNVGSGDVWNQHNDRLRMLHDRHGTLCEDMEAAAVAQVSGLHSRPFLTVKDISNNEFLERTAFDDHGAGIITSELGKRAAKLLWLVMATLSERDQTTEADPSRGMFSD